MLLGYARGKVGSLVFARLKGQQITRAYNPSPNDRKTNKQMTQRVKLPALVAFYQQNKTFFPFAFTNKKTTQSDYNAFVSANLKLADVPYYDKGLIAKGYPVVGPYQGTDGAVSEVTCEWGYLQNGAGDGTANTAVGVLTSIKMPSDFLFENYPVQGSFSISDFSKAVIEANPNIQNGDMITFYLVAFPSIKFGAVIDVNKLNVPNIVASCQITLDINSNETAWGFALTFTADGRDNKLYLYTNNDDMLCLASQQFVEKQSTQYTPTDFETKTYANVAMSVCCVVSRNNGVQQVSRSRFALSPLAESYYQNVNSASSLANAINSYGAMGEALLENKETSFIDGQLTSDTYAFQNSGAQSGKTASGLCELQPYNMPQSIVITSAENAPATFGIALYTEEGEAPFFTTENVAIGQAVQIPSGYGLFWFQLTGAGVTEQTTGSATVTYYL